MRRVGTLSLMRSIASSNGTRGFAVSSTRSASASRLSPLMKSGFADLLRDVASPEVSVADAAKQRVLVVALEVLGELGLVRFEFADHADDDRIVLRDLEHPQVVLDPRARLDLDRADDAQRNRELPIALRVGCHAWHAGRTGIRRALRGDPGRRGGCGCR